MVAAAVSFAADPVSVILADKKGPAGREVIESPTLYRSADIRGMGIAAGEFEFLLDRPRLAMKLARAVDGSIDPYTVQQKADGVWSVDDSGKLTGEMELLSRGPGRRVYLITGRWKFMLGISFKGRMVLAPEYAVHDGRLDAVARGWMKIDSTVAGSFARLAVYLFPGKVDARINRFASAVRMVSEAVKKDPAGTLRRAQETGVLDRAEMQEYCEYFKVRPINK
ncbi:MAG TPA: hypothetical protein VGK71_11020 [Nitrospirota bacterium]